MQKITAGIAGLVLAAGLAACSRDLEPEEYPDFNSDGQIACFDVNGKLREWDDDDCRDDGLYTKSELRQYRLQQQMKATAKPVPTSGGLKTAKQPVPVKPYKNPPARKQ